MVLWEHQPSTQILAGRSQESSMSVHATMNRPHGRHAILGLRSVNMSVNFGKRVSSRCPSFRRCAMTQPRFSTLLALVLIAVAECYHVVSAPLPCVRVAARATPAPVMMAKKQAAGKKVQVVLSQTIKGIGNKGELVLVAAAYAENVVVQGGLGVIASPEILADQERFKSTALRSGGARPRMVCVNTKSAEWCTERIGHCREEFIAARCRATCNNCSAAAGTPRHRFTAALYPS